MAMADRQRSRSPPANRQRGCSPPPTASSLFFPPELIPEVAKRLMSLQDFFALRAACRAYLAVLPLNAPNLASQAPLLFVAVDRTRSRALFRHLTLNRIHRFRLPSAALDGDDAEFHPLGCRMAIYETGGVGALHSNLSIVHLLTGERACLSCPPERLSRVLLSNDLVLTWKRFGTTIQNCHLEAADWSVADITGPYLLQDLIYVNGTLYALVLTIPVTSGYRLAVVEMSENKNSVELVFLGGHWHRPTAEVQDMHLAECYGELILVCAVAFRVYHVFKWKFEEAKWASITSLGGCTMFLAADDHFVGCLGPNHRGIRKDVIYTAAYKIGNWYEYSLDDESSKIADDIYPGSAGIRSRVWVFPSIC